MALKIGTCSVLQRQGKTCKGPRVGTQTPVTQDDKGSLPTLELEQSLC